MFLAHFRTGIAFSSMVGCGCADQADQGQRERGSRGQGRGRTGCGPCRSELLIQGVVQVGTTTAVLGYSRAGSIWYITGGGQLDDGLRWGRGAPVVRRPANHHHRRLGLAIDHGFVSLLSSSGMAIEEVAHLIGHGSASITERVYRKNCAQ